MEIARKQHERHKQTRCVIRENDIRLGISNVSCKSGEDPNASLIKGVICGYRVEEIENPLTQQVRYLDKLVDELAKGRKMEKILR